MRTGADGVGADVRVCAAVRGLGGGAGRGLTTGVHGRYCRATKWDGAQKAIRRLEETLLWRREFGVYDERTSAAHVEPEVRVCARARAVRC